MSYLTDIGTYLQQNGITESIFYDELDDSFPECIAISDYPGFNEYEIVSGEEDADCPSVNIIVRKQFSEDCFAVAWSIYKLLKNKSNITIGGTYFQNLRAKGPPAFLGKTKNQFYERTLNFYTKLY